MTADGASFDPQAVRWQIESYLALGFHPIPLEGKVARYRWKQFSLTQADISHYLKPSVNWGLRTDKFDSSGLWFYVVDLDQKDSLAAVYDHCPVLMDAPLVSTGKGFHIYLTWKEEAKTRHYAKVDIIGNGYVTAPPSIHPNAGKRYTFIKPLNAVPPLIDPESVILEEWKVPASSMLCDSQDKSAENAPLPSVQSFVFSGVPESQRHNMLVRYLAMLFHIYSMPEEEALAFALEQNKRNKPPLPVEEVTYTVHNCYTSFNKRWYKYMQEEREQARRLVKLNENSDTWLE